MNMRKNSIFWLCAAVAIITVTYSIIVFIAKTEMNAVAWVLYAFTIISFAAMFLHFFLRRNHESYELYDVTIFYITLVYLLVQLVGGGIICMMIASLPPVPVAVCELIVVVIYVVAVFIVNAHSQGRTNKEEEAVRDDRLFGAKLQVLEESVSNEELKGIIHSICEQQKYGYAVLSKDVEPLQNKIEAMLELLEEAIENEDEESAFKYAKKIKLMMKERNLHNQIYAK